MIQNIEEQKSNKEKQIINIIENIIEDIIENIIKNKNENDINKTISFIENKIEKGLKKEKIYKSEYYIDYRDVYVLLEDKSIQLVIRYPGGDLSCKTMSDPKSDIYIKLYNRYKKQDIIIFLYKNDILNKEIDLNKILKLIEEISINKK
jgi:hypothetical protein